MIRVEALGKSFDNKKVLSDIDITFEAGKVNLIIGKSGSGKTVLLKSLIGLHSVTTGHIYYGDRDLTNDEFQTTQIFAGRNRSGGFREGLCSIHKRYWKR